MKIKGTKLSTRTLALLAAAVVLLSSGGFMGTRAAISAVGNNYDATIATNKIDISMVDANGSAIGSEDLMKDVTKIIPGHNYDKAVKVKNDAADAYVRVVVRKYWKDTSKKKTTAIKPEAIQLINSGKDITGSGWTSDNWIRNDSECTPETYVFYYSPMLGAGATSDALFTAVRVDEKVLDAVTKTETGDYDEETGTGHSTIMYTYDFDGYQVCLEAEAQAVQTHSPEDAIKSVWGVQATISGDKITAVK